MTEPDHIKNIELTMNSDYSSMSTKESQIDPSSQRFPTCIVWTPLPLITWLFPFIGHMGIATSAGIIRDFAGPYFVSSVKLFFLVGIKCIFKFKENDMAFGKPTRYWQLDYEKISTNMNKKDVWDRAVADASDEYKTRMHNLFCDNCHSHVAMALNLMEYEGSTSWNMIKLCFLMLFHGSFVGFGGFIKTWLPFLIICGLILTVVLATTL